jgi:hypothetical protein
MHFTTPGTSVQALGRTTAIGCLAGILLITPLYAHSPAWTSASSFGGGGSNIGQAVKVDREGNRYVTGAFSATAYFPLRAAPETDGEYRTKPPATAHRSLTSDGGTDVFLAKYDRFGKLIWLAQAGGPEDDEGFDLDFDAAGNIYVTGVFTDNATFRGSSGTEKAVTGGPGQTIFLAKYRPSGVLDWVQTGTAEYDASNNGYGVAVEPFTGSVYVTGVSQGETTFSSSNGTTHSVSGTASWHMVLVKFDTAGNFHWGQSNAAVVNSVAHKVAVDRDNNVYATGWMEGETTFYSNDGHDLIVDAFSEPIQNFPDYPDDAYIVSYDANGNVRWANHIGGYKGIATDIATSRDGRVSITGFIGNIANSLPEQAETIVTSQPGGKNINLGGGIFTDPYNKDGFVATYNPAGVLLDARRFGGAQDEGGSGIVYDSFGNLIVAGIFQGEIQYEGRTLTGKDTFNLVVAKFSREAEQHASAALILDWAREADGPGVAGFENGPRIGLTAGGDVLVTGAYEPAAQFGAFKLNSAGMEDGFLALLSAIEHDED